MNSQRHRSDRDRSTSRNRVWLALISLAIIASFANGISAPFQLDDEVSILQNESIRRLGALSSVLWPRTDVYTAGRPLLNLSFALNYATGGTSVTGYHVTNILIHVLSALTLFGIVRRTLLLPRFGSRFIQSAAPIAFAASLLWSLHPLQTESVTYISQRAESLMGLCYLGTLYGFIRASSQPGTFWPVLSAALCCAGMLVKEVMVTAPVVILLFDRTFLAGSFREIWSKRGRLHMTLAASWLVLFTLMFTTRIADRGVGYVFSFNWHQYLRLESTVVLHYLRLALLPFGLVFDYGDQVSVPSAPVAIACGLLLASLLAWAITGLRRGSPGGFLALCFFLMLAPTSSIVPVAGQPIAENRVYLPLAAFSIALVTGTFQALRQRTYVPLAAVALGFASLTLTRNHDYRSDLAIWTDTVRKRPESARAWCYYGIAQTGVNQIEGAAASFEKALQIRPSYPQAHANLAAIRLNQKRIPEAISHFETAINLKPTEPLFRSNFGSALFQAGRKVEALHQYQEALRIRPDATAPRVNMGIVLAHLGRYSEAFAAFEETLRLDPHNQAAAAEIVRLRAALQPTSSTPR